MTRKHLRLSLIGSIFVCGALGACSNTPSGGDGGGAADMAAGPDLAQLAAPAISSVTPAASSNVGGATITIAGAGFQAGAKVSIGGADVGAVTVASATQLTFTLPAKAATCALSDVVVQNPDGQSATRAAGFRYLSKQLSFQDPTSLTSTVATPRSVLAADLNQDGKVDILAVHSGAGRGVIIRTGKGDGTFNDPVKIDTSASPYNFAVADVNNDQRLDLLVASNADKVINVRLGKPDGTFESKADVSVGISPYAVAVADLNSDGKLDLVAVNSIDRSVSIRLGQGDGTFLSPNMNPDLSVGNSPLSVALADVSGDGKPDILTANNVNAGTVSLRTNKGDGAFNDATELSVGNKPWGLVAMDLNGDGKVDVATANQGDNSVSVVLAKASGGFDAAKPFSLPAGAAPRGLLAADVDGDGRTDLLAANYSGGTVSILLNKGAGDFTVLDALPFGTKPAVVAVADFNGDSVSDLVGTSEDTNNLTLRLGRCQ